MAETETGGEDVFVEVPRNVSGWKAPKGFVSAGSVLGASWEIFRSQLGGYFLLGLVFMLVNGFAGGTGVGIVLVGPLMAGLYFGVQRGLNTGSPDIGDLFKGFNVFVPALVAYLLISVFAGVGFVLCFFPGVIVLMMYKMAYLFIVDRKMDFWQAMEASRKVYFANFGSLTLLYILEGLLLFVGFLLCGVGIYLTFPLTVIMTVVAYQRMVGFQERGDFEPSTPAS